MKLNRRPQARSRRIAAGTLTMALTVPLLVTAAAAPAAAADGDEWIRPFEPAGRYSVYVREDANLGNSELEGALAVGGTLANTKTSSYPIIGYAAGTEAYVPPLVDGDITRLLMNDLATDSANFDVTGAGGVVAADAGDVKIAGEQPGFEFIPRGDFTRYQAVGTTAENGALIDAKHQPYDNADPSGSFYTERGSVADYTESASSHSYDEIGTCLADLPASPASVEVTPTSNAANQIELDLTAGTATNPVVNYVDYEDLVAVGSNSSQIFYADEAPSAAAPLVIRVEESAGDDIIGYEVTSSGNQNESSTAPGRFVMWDFSRHPSDVTWAPLNGNGRTSGAIYAPDTDMTMTFGPHDGQVIANNLTTTGGSDGGATSGELHAYTFLGQIPCAQDTPDTASLTLTKTLDGESTEPDDFAGYTVDVVCTADDATVLDEQYTLVPGVEQTIDGLPVGAECTITETGAGNADATSITVTAGDTSTFPGNNADIVLVDGDNAADITNTYTDEVEYGSASLAKAISVDGVVTDDPADWPSTVPDEVDVTAVCTYDDAEYDFTVSLPTDGTPRSWDGLPVGAECTISEPGDYGQDSVSITVDSEDGAAVTIEADTPHSVVVTNDYSTADISLRKVVAPSASGNSGSLSTYPVELYCEADGQEVFATSGPDGYVPGEPMVANLVPGADAVTFAGLPVGAQCIGSETDTGGAQAVTIEITDADGTRTWDAASGSGTIGGDFSVVITNSFYDTGVTSLAKGSAPGDDDLTGGDPGSTLTVGDTVTLWDTVTVNGFVPENATIDSTLYAFADKDNPVCSADNVVAVSGPIDAAAQGPDASADYSLADFPITFTVDDVEAYGFVERIYDVNGNLIAEGECGAPTESFLVEQTVTPTPPPTPSPTPSPSDTPSPSPSPSTPSDTPDGELSTTGASITWQLPAAIVLALAGLGLVVAVRRRQA